MSSGAAAMAGSVSARHLLRPRPGRRHADQGGTVREAYGMETGKGIYDYTQ